MTLLQIRTLGDPVLRQPCTPVERFDGWLRRTVDDMFETMYAAPGVGLAANQIGIGMRFFVYDDGDGRAGFVANPELSDLEGVDTIDEGCLSIPGPFYPTPRSLRLRLRGQDLGGEAFEVLAEGLLARIFQHEADHLSGGLYIDRLDEEGRRDVMRQLRELDLKRAERS